MSSDHIKRQVLIDENIPKLVKSLTGFNESDENYRLCEEYAFSRIACHRYLSVNSHEVRRRVEGLAERFMADNYTRFGERFKHLVHEFVNDSLCTEHYEYDVQWSILQFLLDVSKNPLTALAENKDDINIDETLSGPESLNAQPNSLMSDLMSSLISQHIRAGSVKSRQQMHDDESDLSDWSDDEDNNAGAIQSDLEVNAAIDQRSNLKLIRTYNSTLKPPQKARLYTEFDASNALEWRKKNIQPAWWLEENYHVKVNSDNPAAKICELFDTDKTISTLSEWCLMREILWMLQLEPHQSSSPTNKYSKFFTLSLEMCIITVNKDVSLASVTVEGMQSILNEFAAAMTILYSFRRFFATIFQHTESVASFIETRVCVPPSTIQCYANGLKEFVSVVSETITRLEMELIKQDPMEIRTIVYLYNELLPHFRMLEKLYDIHMSVYVDYKTNAGHVAVAHLLAGLLHEMNTTALVSRLNLASSLFLTSIRFYLSIFNSWWNEGRFDDWRNEFLVEKFLSQTALDNPTANSYQLRALSTDIAQSIYHRIESCDLIKSLSKESMDAGYIINILYNLEKLNEMKEMSQLKSDDLAESFMKDFWSELSKFRKDHDAVTADESKPKEAETVEAVAGIDQNDSFHELTAEADTLLCMVFEQYMRNTKNDDDEKPVETNPFSAYQIFKQLNETTDFPMPLSIVIQKCIEEILKSRISVANTYVLRIFREEYKVIDHITNLQRVYLLGAGDLMLTFYSNLFKKMNAGENWNNSYLLTVQLDDILTTKYPEMRSLFNVQLTAHDSHTKPYLKAINDISINYIVRHSIRDIIHEKCLAKYNAVFQFLLQIKWAIWTLETLQFPVAFKKRQPYQPLTMLDLIFRRLALVRNWIIYSIQCVHSHLMTFVIQSMGEQLFKKIEKVECLRDIMELHDSYIETIYQACFRKTRDATLRKGVDQMMNLVMVLHDEWNNLRACDSHGDFIDGENVLDISETTEQIDHIEGTYIDVHCFIAEVLSKEVYTKDRTDLASLSAAFSCSCPC